jgi:hypothetical protein
MNVTGEQRKWRSVCDTEQAKSEAPVSAANAPEPLDPPSRPNRKEGP